MVQPNHCDGCPQADGCQEASRRLGGADGPSVTVTVLVAFLLPIVVFVISLGGFGWLLEGRVAPWQQTPLALILALTVTAGWMLVVRVMIRRRHRK
jgi:hypothetical protein